jgi:hypothetical protein
LRSGVSDRGVPRPSGASPARLCAANRAGGVGNDLLQRYLPGLDNEKISAMTKIKYAA